MSGAMLKTTNGPWFVTENDDDYIIVLQASEKKVMRRICMVGFSDTEDANENLANAALIAVAPEMLDALIAIQESVINPACDVVDLIAINTMISGIFAKLSNEAGE